MLLCKQAEKGLPLQVEQFDWLADTDEEIYKQELEAHYSFMEKIQEIPTGLGNLYGAIRTAEHIWVLFHSTIIHKS
uniref:Uncharacterized protein n=1 Tax=Tanacetum cinerariifolium TaxID=118510 RepID=A0A699ULG9_TANCI|nr:hypothetical protein [Tanacetum cinerariifolium]